MSATLGSTTYSSVTWTAGDVITEAKMDSMVANDQAYDSHADEGILLSNNYSFAGKNTGGTSLNLIKMGSGDNIVIGDADHTGYIRVDLNTFEYGQSFTDIVSASDGATITFDLSAGNIHKATLGGNRVLALSNEEAGQSFIIRLTQDGSGSRTVTWWSNISWVGGTAPTLTTTAGDTDVFGFIVTSSGNYDGYIVGQDIS